tara:strand:- start:1619 stop:2527 length:909 start_codon:yes stop_codon:yes gene_type:complete
MKKIALILSGNIRTFFYKNNYIANNYLKLANKLDIDIFIYTDNNDFYYNDCQYFSENNKELVMGIENDYNKRLYKNRNFISYENAHKIIKKTLTSIFGDRLKKLHIEDFNSNKIDEIYDKNNKFHNTFMNNKFSSFIRKKALMNHYYKLHKCYKLMTEYEKENKFEYDIIIKSRMELLLPNLNNIDIKSLDFKNKIYCYKHITHVQPCWAIGDRFIMNKWCNYFLYISLNMVDGIFCNNFRTSKAKNIDEFHKLYNPENDISDSDEFGLTYLIQKSNYNFSHMPVNEIMFKFYDNSLFNYFS